ncbi:endonuclease-3 [Methanomicrobium sp. W14]|uniref:endonuclease III n=1 Tax=Methanomicrobium sp. W14 TaxID=2817839 RepID=UPI001AE9F73F|nr:endonuclease III [Methanomicrobium sp. W14]MBP2132175.1 endonuclease-3 [Methanomicrobium sp. W14]
MHTKDACKIYSVLEKLYVKKGTNFNFLEFENPFQILVMTILSAQTTDKTVNRVKQKLFEKYPDCKSLSKANITEVEELIRSTGFYHSKAKNIVSASEILCREYDCKVPKTIEELVNLPGVGRKTANIVLNHAYNINEGIAVDTHVKRVSFRLGLTENTDPVKVEKDLKSIYPKQAWGKINFLFISHGRAVCDAKKPACEKCGLKDICRYYRENPL